MWSRGTKLSVRELRSILGRCCHFRTGIGLDPDRYPRLGRRITITTVTGLNQRNRADLLKRSLRMQIQPRSTSASDVSSQIRPDNKNPKSGMTYIRKRRSEDPWVPCKKRQFASWREKGDFRSSRRPWPTGSTPASSPAVRTLNTAGKGDPVLRRILPPSSEPIQMKGPPKSWRPLAPIGSNPGDHWRL
jgi:hypothetical protein